MTAAGMKNRMCGDNYLSALKNIEIAPARICDSRNSAAGYPDIKSMK
jgi:hypothetical protein